MQCFEKVSFSCHLAGVVTVLFGHMVSTTVNINQRKQSIDKQDEGEDFLQKADVPVTVSGILFRNLRFIGL